MYLQLLFYDRENSSLGWIIETYSVCYSILDVRRQDLSQVVGEVPLIVGLIPFAFPALETAMAPALAAAQEEYSHPSLPAVSRIAPVTTVSPPRNLLIYPRMSMLCC